MTNQWKVMSEYLPEQHPLLCEEVSEDERYNPQYYRRTRPMTRGRVRNNLKGAAAILSRWPDHWTSFLTYWWIAIGMISLTTFIVYNSIFAFSMLSSANTKPVIPTILKEDKKPSLQNSLLPEIYMHVFAGQTEDIDLNPYKPHINLISNTFDDFKFNIIVLMNDTNVSWMSAEENNELALNNLWTTDKSVFGKEIQSYNVNIELISLSAYMDNSPLRKYWRTLPNQIIEFLARSVSIWEKGGVAFNPDILISGYQHTLYIEKLQNLLNTYAHTNRVISDSKVLHNANKAPKKRRKLNNIREIIDALEKEDISANAFSIPTLSEAENVDIQVVRHVRHLTGFSESVVNNSTATDAEASRKLGSEINASSTMQPEQLTVNHTESTRPTENLRNSTKISLLPLFLEFLFHNQVDLGTKTTEETHTNRTRKSAILEPNFKEDNSLSNNILIETERETKHNYEPLIVSAAGLYNKSDFDIDISVSNSKRTEEHLEGNKLSIDIKGNLIGTDTACHAFLGTMFSNAVNHSDEETITDFIIAELTVFCKGLLSSCDGIDLILL